MAALHVFYIVSKGEIKLNILSAEKISKGYSEKKLLDGVTLGIDEGDKIGLIGVNGTGKSTMLKIIAGVETPDSGTVTHANGIKIGYLPQSSIFPEGVTVLDYLFRAEIPVMQLIRAYEAALVQAHAEPNDMARQKKLIALSQKMDAMDAWKEESRAKSILTRLDVYNFDAPVATLSGGQKKRVAMASALITPAELLILDEPTNHIDSETVDWLETYLKKMHGALLMVTHDRYFLERVTNRIVELDGGKLYSYEANYSLYLKMKLEREELHKSAEVKRRNLLRREYAWISRGAQARSTKQKARIDRYNELRQEKSEAEADSLQMGVASSRLGRKIIDIEHISKSFSAKKLIDDFSFHLLRDDRVGIVGPNGSGKTTLLNMIAGRLCPDSGDISVGETVKIGYFSQESSQDDSEMDSSLRVIDFIRGIAEYVRTDEGVLSASQMLEQFLFPQDVQWKPIAKLSGGEKRRLFLLRVLIGAPNVLLLDEPTNDIDIVTLAILEQYLDDFPGAVITVSHDRYFLDRVVEKLISFESGKIIRYNGAYSDNAEKIRAAFTPTEPQKTAAQTKAKPEKKRQTNKRPKFTFKEQREYEMIDGVVVQLEKKLKDCNADIEKASTNSARLQELLPKRKAIQEKLDYETERWVYLNELAEKIEQYGKE